MCTVTLVPRIDAGGTGVGLRMLCNRDESRQRPAALPPQIRAFSDRRAILPLDAAAGGTWVAVSDAGLAFTLLNRNPQDMRGLDFPGRQSRGQIIPGLLSCASFDEAVAQLKHLNPRHYPPFRLIVADAGHVAVAVGEDDTLRVERFPLVGPVMFTSSGLGDGLVEPPRRALFADIFGSDTTQWETQQDAFHAHRGGGPGELDVCMSRADALSVSLTRVEVGAAGVSMTYHAGPPDQQAPQSTLALPRRESRSRLRRVGRAIARHWKPIVGVYVLLLLASWGVQWAQSRQTPSGRHPTATVPAFDAHGPTDGDPVTLAYTDDGPRDGPVVLMLHGSPGGKHNFEKLVPHLADRYRVIAADMPGSGGSTATAPDYSIASQARYALALMDELNIESAHVLGFSLGSGTALHMAQLAPQRINTLTFYGGIGIQEGEGSGDYHFEHFKYGIAYGLAVWGRDLVPHFGLLGSRSFHNAWTRNFWDTDQRPLRGMLESLPPEEPLLILHGRDDPLVPAWTAYQHHEIVEHSELVMFDGSHFMLFFDGTTRQLADHLRPFLDKHTDAELPGSRRTTDFTADRPATESPLPFGWDLRRGMSPWAQMGVIILATYILEDPTTIFTGLMIAQGQVDFFVGVMAIIIGIFTGDLGLYLIGFVFGRRALAWPPLAKRLPTRHVERLGEWFDRHGWTAVLASRFIPGSRLPLYVSAGALGRKPGRFALWTLGAVVIWAVVMVIAVVLLGDAAASPFKMLFGDSWVALVAAVVVLLVGIRLLLALATRTGRARLRVRIQKLWRWEFWPLWLFQPPVLAYVCWLALRHKGLSTITAVNPGMEAGGFVDESKIDIIRKLPEQWVLPTALVHSADELREEMARRGWAFPLILKPNAGQRGYGLRKVNSDAQLDEYFAAHPKDVLAQTYHPGPFEAGVFYVREPGQDAGRIFSLTDKQFPVLVGDGEHTIEQLVYRHRRYAMQWPLFLRRHGDQRDRILAPGERFALATSGNHCQGTKFMDGSHLVTPELTARFDAIAKQFDGFCFGRFDVRYEDTDAFKRGERFRIIELNGVTSEATHIYDPRNTLLSAYRTLFEQWRIAFRIGLANRNRGAAVTPVYALWKMTRRHYKTRTKANALAD